MKVTHLKGIFTILPALLVMLATGCSNDTEKEISEAVPVTVTFNDFTITQCDLPASSRAASSATSYENVKAITLVFFKTDGSKQYDETQLRTDQSTYETFGTFSLTLPTGSYTMVALGYASSSPMVLNSMTDAAFSEERARETFCYTRNVTVGGTALDLNATLSRITARLDVSTHDKVLSGVKFLRVSPSNGSRGFNPITGLASADAGFANRIDISSRLGQAVTATTYLFLATDKETMDVKLETLDENEQVVYTTTVNDVSLQRNRTTILKGSLFGQTSNASLSFDTDYLPEEEVEF